VKQPTTSERGKASKFDKDYQNPISGMFEIMSPFIMKHLHYFYCDKLVGWLFPFSFVYFGISLVKLFNVVKFQLSTEFYSSFVIIYMIYCLVIVKCQ